MLPPKLTIEVTCSVCGAGHPPWVFDDIADVIHHPWAPYDRTDIRETDMRSAFETVDSEDWYLCDACRRTIAAIVEAYNANPGCALRVRFEAKP